MTYGTCISLGYLIVTVSRATYFEFMPQVRVRYLTVWLVVLCVCNAVYTLVYTYFFASII